MPREDPLVSIIIPVYDEREQLDGALESATKQTYTRRQIIVVADDPHTDLSDVVDRYPTARLFEHEQNRGAGAARNTGIEVSEGELIAFLDVDDRWDTTKIEKQVEVFHQSGSDLGIVYTGFTQIEIDGSVWTRRPSSRGEIYLKELERDRIHPTSTVMIRKECVESVGDFDESLSSRQDYDLWIRITEQYTVDYVDELLVRKRERSDNISKDFDARIAGDEAVLRKVGHRISKFDYVTRSRVLSYHYHVLGRDYGSNGNRRAAVHYLTKAILRYPIRPVTWLMLFIVTLGIDRNGKWFTAAKRAVFN